MNEEPPEFVEVLLQLQDEWLREDAAVYAKELELPYAVFCARYLNIQPDQWAKLEDHQRLAWYTEGRKLMDEESNEQANILKNANQGINEMLETHRQVRPAEQIRRYAG